VVEPYVDAVRLKAVIPELAAEIPATSPRREPELRPLQTSSATLKLWQPSAAGAAAVERKGMPIDLANGFLDSITLPLDGFRQMYAAACSSADTSLFTGVVLVDTGTPPQETIPFSVRFADTHGELLSFTEQPSDAVAVQMENSTESPLRIPSLPVTIRRGGAEVPAIVEGLALPLDNVAPGTRIPFTVRPQQPLPGSGPLDAVFDTSAVQVLPDAQKILPLISDTSVPAQYERQIEVDTLPDLLGDPASDTAIIAVAVEFRNSGVLRLQRDHLSGIASVRLPLMDLLLGRDVQGKYSFRQHIVRKNGTQTNDETWRESDQGILFVPIT